MALVEKTQERILDAASILLAQNPETPLSDIAKKAGVGRATLHRYYSTREDLFRKVIQNIFAEFEAALDSIRNEDLCASEILEALIRVYVPLGESYRLLQHENIILADKELAQDYNRLMQAFENLVAAVKAEGKMNRDIPTAWVEISIDALVYHAWLGVQNGRIAKRDAPDLVIRTLFKGLS